MESAQAHPLPARDPVSGGPLVITELQGVETGITIRGRFEMPRFAQLSADQARFLETFLRCRGMLNSVEKELGISYPTARARLDAVLRALDLTPRAEDASSLPPEPLPETPEVSAPPEPPSAPEPPETAVSPGFASPGPVPPGEVGSAPVAPSEEKPRAEEMFNEAVGATPSRRSPMEILDAIERGEITPEEAKKQAKNP